METLEAGSVSNISADENRSVFSEVKETLSICIDNHMISSAIWNK